MGGGVSSPAVYPFDRLHNAVQRESRGAVYDAIFFQFFGVVGAVFVLISGTLRKIFLN
jgi:hypothetical protein